MIAISTLVSEDGVIGLNGKRYVLDDYGDVLLFKTKNDARLFVAFSGEDPYIEYIDYEEMDGAEDG